MSCIINMIRYDKENIPFFKQEFNCPIPIHVIKLIMEIENTQWRKFCFSPFNSLSKFIVTNIDNYPTLKSYINKQCKPFDFSYQYITDISSLSKTIFTKNISIFKNEFYLEKWIAHDYLTNEYVCFFELEHSRT